MARPSWFARIRDWVFRSTAIEEARGPILEPRSRDNQTRALTQAKLLVEVARRVAHPVERLPSGSTSAVLFALYREAVTWLLSSLRAADGHPPGNPSENLATLWATTPRERLLAAAGDPPTLEALRISLLERGSTAESFGATDRDVARGRMFAEALLSDLDRSNRLVDGLLIQRWLRVTLLGIVVLVPAVLGWRAQALGPDLVAERPFRTSSTNADCVPPSKCAEIIFHTLDQDNPWVDFDLGALKTVRRVEVRNRMDCCTERAAPLIVEVSVDDKTWVEVARRETQFWEWTATFPGRRARYVRLRVPRQTMLHLAKVVVR